MNILIKKKLKDNLSNLNSNPNILHINKFIKNQGFKFSIH